MSTSDPARPGAHAVAGVRCYLCQAEEIVLRHPRVRDRGDVRVLACGRCGLVFLDRTDHVRGDFYAASGMYGGVAPDPAARVVDDEEDTERRVAALRWLVQGKAYLDFGAGTGATASRLVRYARRVAVVEPNKVMRTHARERLGLEGFASIEEMPGGWDVVSLFHVLEHLEDPRAVLRDLAERLAPGGRLVVEVPSAADALLGLYGSAAFADFTYWSCHLYLFDPRTMATLVAQAGLELEVLEQVQRYPLANHLHWLARGKPGGHKTWGFLRDPVLDTAYARALGSLGLCDTIVARLRRPGAA